MLAYFLLFTALGLLTQAQDYTCGRQYPQTQRSQGFILVANVTDPAKDFFDPPINHWYLDRINSRVGIVSPAQLSNKSEAHIPIYFLNGTLEDARDGSASINNPPQQFKQLLVRGLHIEEAKTEAGGYVGVYVNRYTGTPGTGISSWPQSPYGTLFPPEPFRSFKFMACNGSEPVYWYEPYVVSVGAVVPADCVEITLLAQCATLPLPLLDNNTDGPWNWVVQEVDCYPNVTAIDWTMY